MEILVTRVGAIGDTILLSTLLQNLRNVYPRSEIHVLGHPERVHLLLGLPNADKVISSEDPWWLELHQSQPPRDELKGWLSDYDLVFCFSSEPTGILERNMRDILGAGLVHHPALPPEDYDRHYVEFLLEPLAALGGSIQILPPVVACFPERGIPAPLDPACWEVVIHPGGGGEKKRWPLGCFLTLAGQLAEKAKARCCFLLGPAETGLEPRIVKAGQPVLQAVSLDEVIGLLRSARGYAGNDSGISHLAAALGTPTVAVFTATDPAIWCPLGRRVCIIDARGAPSRQSHIDRASRFLLEQVRPPGGKLRNPSDQNSPSGDLPVTGRHRRCRDILG
jgi:ADP-heptose:LPS heptosyltransferase